MRQPTRRALALAFSVSAAALTSGCADINAMLAGLFRPQPTATAALAAPAPPAPPLVADQVVVLKGQRLLELRHTQKVIATFPIALGPHAHGTKQRAGDGRTPEGTYRIDWRTMKTRWSRELHISYPDARDRAEAEANHVNPGGDIFIHGMPADFGPYDPPKWDRDWTEGCIAVGNAAIVKIWDAVPDGTPVEILP